MDAGKLPLFRLRLAQFSKQTYRLACIWHHGIMDIWVSLMAIQEVLARYEAIHSGVASNLPARRPFRDYVEWIETKKQTAAAEEFWCQHLGDFSMQALRNSVPRFWSDDGRDQTELRNNRIEYVPADLVGKIQAFARKHQLTQTTVFYAAWSLVQSVYQDEADIVMHTTTSGRWSELDQVETILGPIVANQPFRVNTGFSTSVEDWLTHLQAQHGLVQSYDFVSVADIQEWAKRVPPIWCVLVFQNFPLKLWQTTSKTLAVQFQHADVWLRRPLSIFFFPNSSEGFRIQMIYDPGRFTETEIGKAMQAMMAAAEYLTGESKMNAAEMKGRLRSLLAQ
jgi:hypothetical protein